MKIQLKRGLSAAAVLVILIWSLPAAAQKGEWPQIGYDAGHNGYNAGETTINASNVANLANTGSFATTAQVVTQPVVSDGIVYVDSQDEYLYAYDVSTGQLVWKVDAGTNIDAPTGMVLAGSRIIVSCQPPSSASGLCAFNAKTGKALWSYKIGNNLTAPAISGDTVYFATYGTESNTDYAQNVVAVDVKTGTELWRLWDCNNSVVCVQFVTAGETAPSPRAVANGLVYTTCYGEANEGFFITVQGICAVDTSNGSLVWQTQIGTYNGHVQVNGFSAEGGYVFVSYNTDSCYQCNYTINVTKLNGQSGAVVWDRAITGTLNDSYQASGAPAIGPGGTLYQTISANNDPKQHNLFALNANTGKIKWSESTTQLLTNGSGPSSTIVAKGSGETLFFTCNSYSCAFDANNHSLLWQSPDGGGAGYAPIVTGGTVYNVCYSNNVCAYQPK